MHDHGMFPDSPDRADLPPAGTVIERDTARVLPVDERRRVLLLHGRAVDDPEPSFWFSVGGARDPHEAYPEAAARELREETGIEVIPDQLGSPVHQSVIEFDWAGLHVLQSQTFFTLRVSAADVSFEAHDVWERQTVDDFRWWAPEELAASGETFHPELLALARRVSTGS